MSLLDNGPHTVTVYPEESFTDQYGNPGHRPAELGIVVSGCILTPIAPRSDTDSSNARGGHQWKFLARDAPLGKWSRVEWNDNGTPRTLHTQHGPTFHTATSERRHVAAILAEA